MLFQAMWIEQQSTPVQLAFDELHRQGISVSSDISAWLLDCSGFERKILFVVSPKSHDEVANTVAIMNRFKLPFHAVSTGKNWGYGTALPAAPRSVLIYLGEMNKISNFHSDLGTVNLEPGVTQKQLSEFLQRHDDSFFTPTTGAGFDVSILANALERGFGLAPIEDHASAIVSLKAVLPTGKTYESYFRALGSDLSKCYHWGVGPYIDQIFAQSNLGIVTEITLLLAKKTQATLVYTFKIRDYDELSACAESFREMRQQLPGSAGTLKIFSQEQLLNTAGKGSFISRWILPRTPWIGVGILHSTRNQKAGLVRDIKKILKHLDLKPVQILSIRKIHLLRFLFEKTILRNFSDITRSLISLQELTELAQGTPSNIGLKMIYPDEDIRQFSHKNPAVDGKGLIWFSPMSELKGDRVVLLHQILKSALDEYGFSHTPITFTVLTSRCLAAVVPILFDKTRDANEARKMYLKLLERCQEYGFYPYRIPIEFMPNALSVQSPEYWQTLQWFKTIVDPQQLFASGRYEYRASKFE